MHSPTTSAPACTHRPAVTPPKAVRHVFEQAGLGAAPYTFLRVDRGVSYCACPGAPVQPGGACDFCGTGIYDHFYFRSADGREFKVGCDCLRKSGDKGFKRVISDNERVKRVERAEKKHARDMFRIWTAWARRDAVAAVLASKPHPKGFTDRQTGAPLTLLDWADWMMACAGTSGRLQVASVIEAIEVAS